MGLLHNVFKYYVIEAIPFYFDLINNFILFISLL